MGPLVDFYVISVAPTILRRVARTRVDQGLHD